jgi:xanthine/uracil/vitamin C permease (AzgA family)
MARFVGQQLPVHLPFVKLGSGKHRQVSSLMWVLAVLFLVRYAFLGSE